jgi:nicotinamidase-related amidase
VTVDITRETLTRGLAADWRDRLREWPLPLPRFTVDLPRTTLIVIDMQYGSVDPETGVGPYLRERHAAAAEYYYGRVRETVVPNIQRLLRFFREAERPVIYLTIGFAMNDRRDGLGLLRQIDDDLRAQMASGPLVRRGSHANTVIDALAPRDGEIVINKTSMGAFNSTALDQTLRNLGLSTLVVTGVSTECCVATTARDAGDRGYHVLLVEDACTAVTPYLQESSLVTFAAMFGRVETTKATLAELSALHAARR